VAVVLLDCIREVPGSNFGFSVAFSILDWLSSEFGPTSGRTPTVHVITVSFNIISYSSTVQYWMM
jgi:hypothetical protein